MVVQVSQARIKRLRPIPSRAPPGRRARRATFPCLRAMVEQPRSKTRSLRKDARPLVSLAARISPAQLAPQRRAAVVPRLPGTTTPAGARLESPASARTALGWWAPAALGCWAPARERTGLEYLPAVTSGCTPTATQPEFTA